MAKRKTAAARKPTLREHYARESAKIEEQFEHEMRGAWERLQGESWERFFARLRRSLESGLRRVAERQREALLRSGELGLSRGPGRPRTRQRKLDTRTILTGWRPPSKGRPPRPLSESIKAVVTAAAAHVRPQRSMRAEARARVVEDLKTRDPARYRHLVHWQSHYECEHDLSPERALTRALARPSFQKERLQSLSLARRFYYALSGGRRTAR